MNASIPPALPNLFLIGAPKCATTSVHGYLGIHPDISMTSVKEPQIFASRDYAARLHEYQALLDPRAALRGESSVVYSQYPRWPGIPERIARVSPDARFLYLVRDPVERAIAHYAQHVQDGKEQRSLVEALADYEQLDSLYLCPSRYATQLRRYLACFARSQILVLDITELATDPAGALQRVFGFLNLDPSKAEGRFSERRNTREDHRVRTRTGRFVTRLWPGQGRAPGPLRALLRPLLSRPRPRPELPVDLERRLRTTLASEVEWLREWSGVALEGWSSP